MDADLESKIRLIVSTFIEGYAEGFSDRHLREVDDPEGTINMKINNIFISALGNDIQYYSALSRSLDSSLGNTLEKMAIKISKLQYEVTQHVEGYLSNEQTEFIATLLEKYKRRVRKPNINDYKDIAKLVASSSQISKRHESDYYLYDKENDLHYLIELKIGGDLDNKKARSEKEALLEQYCILSNTLGTNDRVKIFFATAYNRYGEGNPWTQERVLQFFEPQELLISKDFWNLICKSSDGYDIVIDEYKKNAHHIIDALNKIKKAYIPEPSND